MEEAFDDFLGEASVFVVGAELLMEWTKYLMGGKEI